MVCAGGNTHSVQTYVQMILSKGACPHNYASGSGFLLEFLEEDVHFQGRLIGGQGNSGSRTMRTLRIRKGAGDVKGVVRGYVSAGDFVNLLPLLIGDSVVGTTFSLADDLPYFGILVKRDYGVFEYQNCKVDSWLLQSEARDSDDESGEPDMLYLTMHIRGTREDTTQSWPVSPPTLASTAGFTAYAFSDCDAAVTLGGTVRPIQEFALQMQNFLQLRYVNSLHPWSIRPTWRRVGFRARLPWVNANDDLYEAAEAGVTGNIKFTYATVSTDFQFANMKFRDRSPTGRRKFGEVPLELDAVISSNTANGEMTVVNDSTV